MSNFNQRISQHAKISLSVCLCYYNVIHVHVSWSHQMTNESNIPANYNNMLQEDRPQTG